jgi:hypothetical protein
MNSTLVELGDDLVIFCGTVPLLTGEFRAGRLWRLGLQLDPNTSLTHSYEVLPHDG